MIDALRFQTIVVPLDFSPESRRALEMARRLAKAAGPAHLILLHAYFLPVDLEALAAQQNLDLLALLSSRATEELERTLEELQDAGISCEFLVSRGYPEAVIVELARDKSADVIVMGTRGRTGLAHVVLGSIAERVLREAPCPVVTVKGQRNDRAPAL